MIKSAIFDADGTLFDSMFVWDGIGEYYLRSIGYEPRENLNEAFKSMSLYQAACYYRSEHGVSLSTDEIIDGVNALIEEFYKNEVPLKAHVKEFLEMLCQNGVKMCVATATDRPYISAALKRCGVREYFSEIFTCASVGHGKDEAVIYREAAKFLGTEKKESFVFEDALYALTTAKTDGFPVIGVYDKYEKEQKKIKELSDFYLMDYSDFNGFWKFASEF